MATYDASKLCGAPSGQYICDREKGHTGDHRGYNEERDTPMFWSAGKRLPNDPAQQSAKHAEHAEHAELARRLERWRQWARLVFTNGSTSDTDGMTDEYLQSVCCERIDAAMRDKTDLIEALEIAAERGYDDGAAQLEQLKAFRPTTDQPTDADIADDGAARPQPAQEPVTFSMTTVDGDATAAPGTPFNGISTIASGVGTVFDSRAAMSSPSVADGPKDQK